MSVLKWLNPDLARVTLYEPGRPIEEVAREQGLDPAAIAKLASNENPLGASRRARQALRQAIDEAHLYPDGNAFYLREKLAQFHQVAPDQIIFGNGSNELLEFLGHAFLGPGRSVVFSQYTFVIYKMMATMFGATAVEVQARNHGHNLVAMRRAVRPDTSLVFVCNPNNPTGTFVGTRQVRDFVDRLPADTLPVFDEAYAEICLGRMPDTLKLVREGRHCLVLRSFSKAYGLAGLRIGYGIGPAPVIEALERARQPFNTNRLAQAAALAALDDQGFVRRSRHLFRQGRALFERLCRELQLEFVRTFANFMLVKVGDAARINRELTKRGLIVRPMAGYGLPEWLRISFGTMAQNERLAAALRELCRHG
ncbi:MAG: histidinol-phosphate transaminase [Lentisphaeria bacterium]|jgi:histidinol-phosphate aminotransferase